MRGASGRLGGAALAALLLAGCGGADPQEPVGAPAALAGRWLSTFSSEFVILELSAAGVGVEGTAELMPRGVRARYEVTGRMVAGELRATLQREGAADAVALRATLARDTLKIRLDGGGFSDRLVPLVRE